MVTDPVSSSSTSLIIRRPESHTSNFQKAFWRGLSICTVLLSNLSFAEAKEGRRARFTPMQNDESVALIDRQIEAIDYALVGIGIFLLLHCMIFGVNVHNQPEENRP